MLRDVAGFGKYCDSAVPIDSGCSSTRVSFTGYDFSLPGLTGIDTISRLLQLGEELGNHRLSSSHVGLGSCRPNTVGSSVSEILRRLWPLFSETLGHSSATVAAWSVGSLGISTYGLWETFRGSPSWARLSDEWRGLQILMPGDMDIFLSPCEVKSLWATLADTKYFCQSVVSSTSLSSSVR